MGRRDPVQVTIEVIARMRHYLPALVVSYEPGWERRGNGTAANYDFANVHHTASPTSLARPFPTQGLLRDGRTGLAGPLCNEAGPACTVDAPRIHVMAAHPANHAGASRASGPVPALSLYNPRSRGLEIDYAGSVPMLIGQLLVAHVWTRANADVLAGGNVEHVRAHAETSITGKWDPGYAPGKTIDMAAFRRVAATLAPGAAAPASPPPPPVQEDDDMPLLVNTGTKGIWVLDPIGYHWIGDVKTVHSMQAAGVKAITISDAEHNNWLAAQSAINATPITVQNDVALDVDEVALATELVKAGFSSGASAEEMANVIARRLIT